MNIYDLNLTNLHRELVKNKSFNSSLQYLSKLVKQDLIPHNGKTGKQRLFNFKDVKKQLKIVLKNTPQSSNPSGGVRGKYKPKPETSKRQPTITSKLIKLKYEQIRNLKVKTNELTLLYIKKKHIKNEMSDILKVVEDEFLKLPISITPLIVNLTDPHQIKEIIYEQITFTLNNLAEVDIKKSKVKLYKLPKTFRTLPLAKLYHIDEQIRLERIKADISEGKMLLRGEVENKAFTNARVGRNQLLTIPERLSDIFANMNDEALIIKNLTTEIKIIIEGFTDVKIT